MLPMRVSVTGFSYASLSTKMEELRKSGTPLNKKIVEEYVKTVAEAVDGVEVRFIFSYLLPRERSSDGLFWCWFSSTLDTSLVELFGWPHMVLVALTLSSMLILWSRNGD